MTSFDQDLWTQNLYRDLVADDWSMSRLVYSPNSLIGARTRLTDPDVLQSWQLALDVAYRGFATDLLKVVDLYSYPNAVAFLNDLRICNPFGDSPKNALLWNGISVCATDKLVSIVEHFFPNNIWDRSSTNDGFATALSQIYHDSGLANTGTSPLPLLAPR